MPQVTWPSTAAHARVLHKVTWPCAVHAAQPQAPPSPKLRVAQP